MRPVRLLGLLAIGLLVVGLAFGLRAGFGDLLGKPSLEQQTRTLAQQLRCPVCTGQSVAESDSTVANDMRAEIRARLEAGDDPAAILAGFESRYGAWIINRPPARGWYLLIWAGPFAAAVFGAWGVRRYLLRQQPPTVRAHDDGGRLAADVPGAERSATDRAPDEVSERLKDYL